MVPILIMVSNPCKSGSQKWVPKYTWNHPKKEKKYIYFLFNENKIHYGTRHVISKIIFHCSLRLLA